MSSGGTTTTTSYVGSVEEVATRRRRDYHDDDLLHAGEMHIATAVNGSFSYPAGDVLARADVTQRASVDRWTIASMTSITCSGCIA